MEEKLEDKIINVLNAMEESIKENSKDEKKIERIHKIEKYIKEDDNS